MTRSGRRTTNSSTKIDCANNSKPKSPGAYSFFSCDAPLVPCGGFAVGIAHVIGCPLPNTCLRWNIPIFDHGAGPNSLGTQNQKKHPQNSVTNLSLIHI